MKQGQQLRQWARGIKRDTLTLALALHSQQVPWYAKLIAATVVIYALSPIDLIPDMIPILGYLDDLLILPLGIALALRLIPAAILAQLREQAQSYTPPRQWRIIGMVLILLIWGIGIGIIANSLWQWLRR
ncbi:MAG: hypothetical protein Fur005_07890 [Roseiflexaceae bacterium]